MVTIKDVANRAGVSPMTVSRVINKKDGVNKKTREKVMEVVKELNYVPNTVARSMVTKSTKTIGILIATIVNPFYSQIVLGAEEEALKNGYNVILCNAGDHKKAQRYINLMIEKCADGIICFLLNIGKDEMDTINSVNMKCVLVDNEKKKINTSAVLTNNVMGGYLAAKHLIDLGHTRIAHIHGAFKYNPKKKKYYEETYQFELWRDRYSGFSQAIEEAGVVFDKRYLVEGNGSTQVAVESGFLAMKKLLELDNPPTAVFAANDLMAMGAINAIYSEGLKVPEDISIVGYDDIDLSKEFYPKLTTVSQPRNRVGKEAVKLLIESLKSDNIIKNVSINPVLEVRESTRRI